MLVPAAANRAKSALPPITGAVAVIGLIFSHGPWQPAMKPAKARMGASRRCSFMAFPSPALEAVGEARARRVDVGLERAVVAVAALALGAAVLDEERQVVEIERPLLALAHHVAQADRGAVAIRIRKQRRDALHGRGGFVEVVAEAPRVVAAAVLGAQADA